MQVDCVVARLMRDRFVSVVRATLLIVCSQFVAAIKLIQIVPDDLEDRSFDSVRLWSSIGSNLSDQCIYPIA